MNRSEQGDPALETPAAVVDLDRVRANARRAAEYCRRHGLAWRPHVKTHKSLGIARIQLEAGARGLTVATPREAEVMAEVCDDLLLAHPPLGPGKLDRLMDLPSSVTLTVALDSPEALEGLAGAARRAGRSVGVLVELDVGMGRVGVPDPESALALARECGDLEGVVYRGILFYPGHIRVPAEEQSEAIARVSSLLDRTLERLAGGGAAPEVVSGGSTPTIWRSHDFRGLTEVRAGTVIYNDRDILSLGACGPEDLAYVVRATVVSTAVPGRAVVDAGSKALAKETFRSAGEGFAVVVEHPEVEAMALSEEHGILDLSRSSWRPRVGEVVHLVPNHVCVSVNLQDLLWVRTGGTLECWPVEARGRAPWGFGTIPSAELE